jgi:hypothetical protein
MQKLKKSLFYIIILLTTLFGCLKSNVEIGTEPDLYRHDYKGLVFLSDDPIHDHMAECIRKKVSQNFPNFNYVEGKFFRDSLYPWFESSTMPTSIKAFSGLMSQTKVKDRINHLGVDLIIQIHSETRTVHHDGVMTYTSISGSASRETRISASIWDLNNLKRSGDLIIDHEGTVHWGLLLIIPYYIPASTETASCREASNQIIKWLK